MLVAKCTKRTETNPNVNQLCCLFRLFSFLCVFPRHLDLGFDDHTTTLFLCNVRVWVGGYPVRILDIYVENLKQLRARRA